MAKFIVDTAWEPELEMALLGWPAALLDVDARAKFQTEDVAKRPEVIRDRFEVIMSHHSSTRQWVSGATSSLLKGLMLEYIRLHGKECLVPRRREPLTNTQIDAILSIPNGTRLGRFTADWDTPLFHFFSSVPADST